MDERVTSLEIKMTYHEDIIEQLNSVIIEQQKEIDTIKKSLKKFSDHLNSSANPDLKSSSDEEPPPHY